MTSYTFAKSNASSHGSPATNFFDMNYGLQLDSRRRTPSPDLRNSPAGSPLRGSPLRGVSPARSASPAKQSPQLQRKAVDRLDGTEKTGVALNTPWTFWLDKIVPRTTASEYEANLRKIYTVSTVESFWAVYNNIPEPYNVKVKHGYHLMRNQARPLWEDSANSNGGMWKLKCYKHLSNHVWKTLLLACIGEQFSDEMAEGDEIMGLSISIRDNEDLIQIWNYNSTKAEESRVLQKLKGMLPGITFPTMFYKPHQQHYAYEGNRMK